MLLTRHFVAGWLVVSAVAVVCPAQPSGPQALGSMFGTDGAARVVQLTGQVSVLKDSTPWALEVGNLVHVKQIIVTGPDGFAVFQVSDGSTFEVYPSSRVTFRANPSNWRDLLDVWLGRVKVHIEKLSGQPNHNRIKTPTAVISVRGTTFDVAVEDEISTLVSVDEGQVVVTHALLPSKEKVLNQGDSIRVYKDQPIAQRNTNKDAAVQQVLRAASEALYRVIYRSPTPTAGGGGQIPSAGGGTRGDTETTTPPPPPPPAPEN
jgi:hypothetical protein